MKLKLEQIIDSAINEIAADLDIDIVEKGAKTYLFGENGIFDSMALVTLIADIEDRLSDEYDIDLVLADEKAMSATKSPFRSASSLVDYIQVLMEGNIK